MTIIVIDHVAIRNFKDPTAVADYQRIEDGVGMSITMDDDDATLTLAG
jgi:hypothetical protein